MRAAARLLAGEGAKLILGARREERLQKLAAELKVPSHVAVMDVRDEASIRAALDALPAEFREIDVLVNNAGLALGLANVEDANPADWQAMIDTNIVGLITMTRLVLPGMKKRGRGHIVDISSVAGNFHYPWANVYGASKAFVTYFSQALRAEMVGSPVRVTNIEPGMAETEFSEVRFHGDAAKAKEVYKGVTPLSAMDVAEAIRWALVQPAHVNISRIELMPVMQAPAGITVKRAG
ncbi:MAG: SDR family NAD(P)-dependent oxidoreductase [Alphaproteobacteria bacterium]